MAYRGMTGKLPVGSQGFTGTKNPSQAGPGHLTYVDGAELDGGIIRKEGGAQKLNIEALAGVTDTQTKLLLHMDGADASVVFTDSSAVPHVVGVVGNAQIDTAQSKFGGAGGLFDGTGDNLTLDGSVDFAFGTGDFTIDFWSMRNAIGAEHFIYDSRPAAGTGIYVEILITAANILIVRVNGTIIITGTTTITAAVWRHIALVRQSGISRLYLNGVLEGVYYIDANAYINGAARPMIGGSGNGAGSSGYNGWLDEFRVSTGIARWVSTFTPPAYAYSNLSPPGAVVISGINWDPTSAGHQDVVFLSNGTVRRDSGAGNFPDTLVSGLTSVRQPPPVFVTAGGEAVGAARKLFLFSSPNQVQVASGTGNFAAIPAPPADWAAGSFPTFGVQHGLRMFGGGNSGDPHRIYYSTIANHGDFTGAGSGTLSIFPGEAEGLVAGISFRGALILFKYPLGIYIVNTADPTPANWQVVRMTRSVGSLNQHCIVQIENDILYMDHVGNIHALSATQEFGDINTSDLSKFATLEPFIRSDINRSAIRRATGVWYAAKRQAWFSLPQLGATDNNLRLIMGFDQLGDQNQQRVPPRFFISRRDTAVAMWMRPDTEGIPRPTIGDSIGFVWKLDGDARNKDGVAYPIRFNTANTDLAFLDPTLATKMKSGQFLELASEPRGDWNLTVEVFWDDILTDTLQFSMGNSGAVLGSFTLDVDLLGSEVVKSDRKRLTGSGRRIRLAADNSGLDEDVSISEFHLSFTVMDERVREL